MLHARCGPVCWTRMANRKKTALQAGDQKCSVNAESSSSRGTLSQR